MPKFVLKGKIYIEGGGGTLNAQYIPLYPSLNLDRRGGGLSKYTIYTPGVSTLDTLINLLYFISVFNALSNSKDEHYFVWIHGDHY